MKNSEPKNIQSHSRNTVLCDGFLIPMTDFVLKIDEFLPQDLGQFFDSWRMSQLRLIENYAKFLKQPLKLEMFVPCDEDGNILEEPNIDHSKYYTIQNNGYLDRVMFNDDVEIYEQAKEKVLFEGFEIVNTRAKGRVEVRLIGANVSGSSDTIQNDFAGLYFYDSRNEKRRLHTIEGLLNFHPLKLTPTAIKQIQP